MSYVFNTTRTVAKYLRKSQVVILESTTYPGTTDVCYPRGNRVQGRRGFLSCFSPEREDPNNGTHSTRTMSKVVGGYMSGKA